MQEKKKLPPVWLSFLPLILLVLLLFFVISAFGSDALSGASQIALLVTSACCILLGMAAKTMQWEDFEISINKHIGDVSQSILILLLIGAVGGAWMISGIVPTMIYYGMQIISPQWFLVSACAICAAISVMTGSSWTTIATIGIALLGIGKAQGFHEGWIAGAIISGAYFGDKVSPMSETTVLASSTTHTPLFTHIRYMMYTTTPTFVIALIVFTVKGLMNDTSSLENVSSFADGLSNVFNISPWLLVVPLLTGIMIYRRLPAAGCRHSVYGYAHGLHRSCHRSNDTGRPYCRKSFRHMDEQIPWCHDYCLWYYIHRHRRTRTERPGRYQRNVRHDEHDMADFLRHDIRCLHECGRNDRKYHENVHPHHSQCVLVSGFNGRRRPFHEHRMCRPVSVYHSDRQHVQGTLQETGVRKPVAEPDHRGRRNGHVRTDSVELMRYDTVYGAGSFHLSIFPFLCVQLSQSDHVTDCSCYRLQDIP